MNKSLLIGGTVVVVAVAAWAVFGRNGGGTDVAVKTSPGVTAAPAQNGGSTSMRALLTSGKPQQCTSNVSAPNTTTVSTIYFRDNKMRNDFTTQSKESNVVKGHIILSSGWFYSWTDGAAQGIKVAVNLAASPAAGADQSVLNGIDTMTSFDCRDVNSETSLFVPPATVTFTDYSSAAGAQ